MSAMRDFWINVVAPSAPNANGLGQTPVDLAAPVSVGNSQTPTLMSLWIEPADGTIDGNGTLPLKAVGLDSNGDRLEMTFSVDWVSSAADITIDDSGVAHARPVSVTSIITATDPVSTMFARTTLTVKDPTPQAPPAPPKPPTPAAPSKPHLQLIKIEPASVSVFVNDSIDLKAIGYYADGSKFDITADVIWSSFSLMTDPVVDGPMGPFSQGDWVHFRAVGEGPATITAAPKTGDVPAANASVTVAKRPAPPPPPPPPPVKVVQTIYVKPDSVQALPGEDWTFRFQADPALPKGVVWSCVPETIASIDKKSGALHSKAIGQATISAKDPVSGAEGKAQISVVDPKSAFEVPKPPKSGTIAKDDYAALIEALVGLSQDKYMHWEMAPVGVDAPKVWPKDSTVRKYIELAMQMVAFWNTDGSLPIARGMWKRIQGPLSNLLKDALDPKVGVKPRDVQMGREAMDRLDKYVTAPREGNERLNIRSTRHKSTPFGSLDLWHFEEPEIMPILDTYDEIKLTFPTLQQKANLLEERQKTVEKATKPPADYVKDIKANATKAAQREAKDLRNAANIVKTVHLLVGNIKDNIETAKTQVDNFLQAVSTAELSKSAMDARRAAEEEGAKINAVLSVFKGAMIAVTEGPAAALELVDVVKDLRGVFSQTDLEASAERLENQAHQAQIKDANNNLSLARTSLANAEKFLKQAEEHIAALGDDADLMRAEAEAAFDQPSAGNKSVFKFKPVSEGIDLARDIRKLAAQIQFLADRAEIANKELDKASRKPMPMPGPHQNRPEYGSEVRRVINALMADLRKLTTQAGTMDTRAETLNKSLREIRVNAHDALFTSKDPRKKS